MGDVIDMGLMDGFKKNDKNEFVLPVRGKFKGELAVEGNVRINGEAVGSVLSEQGKVVCGPQSAVVGTVEGVDIYTFGSIDGDVTSKGQLSVYAGASLKGDVIASALVIESGASYIGNVVINAKEAAVLLEKKSPTAPVADNHDKLDTNTAKELETGKHY